jgi:hypothetical protein
MRFVITLLFSCFLFAGVAKADAVVDYVLQTKEAAQRGQISWTQRARMIRQRQMELGKFNFADSIMCDYREMLAYRIDSREISFEQMDQMYRARLEIVNQQIAALSESNYPSAPAARTRRPTIDYACVNRCTSAGSIYQFCEAKCSY